MGSERLLVSPGNSLYADIVCACSWNTLLVTTWIAAVVCSCALTTVSEFAPLPVTSIISASTLMYALLFPAL